MALSIRNPHSLLVSLLCALSFFREFSKAGKVGDIAELPPRGWNSYDSFSWVVDEATFLHNAEILAQKLLSHGYEYAVVDFLWYRKNVEGASVDSYGYDCIDKWGRPYPDLGRWPSSSGGKGFAEVAQKVHGLGLKFGIHLMRGMSTEAFNTNTPILDIRTGKPYTEGGRQWTAHDIGLQYKTCAWMKHGFLSVNTDLGAGRAFLRSLYQQYMDWGVDFVKLDCVFGDDYSPEEIMTVSELLQELERPVVLSISPGTSVTPTLANDISKYVNMYRITGDDWDKWLDVSAHFDVSRDFAAAKKIGVAGLKGKSWPDLDMLPLGWLTDPGVRQGPHRKCNLTLDEQKTQVTLWSMAKSPLMFGGDLRHIDKTTLGLIANPTLLEINYYSSNNMEFPYVETEGTFGNENHAPQKTRYQVSLNEPEEMVLGLTSCRDGKAKGWHLSSKDAELDQVCWNNGTGQNRNHSFCIAKTKPLLTSDGNFTYNKEYQDKFHLLASEKYHSAATETGDACLDASVSGRRSAAEPYSVIFSRCKWHTKQVWGLKENGTLLNSYSNLCAMMTSKKDDTISGGIRAWIATGRTGEIYLAFFNLNPTSTNMIASISDVAKVVGGSFFSKGSCRCREVWSGKNFGSVRDKLSAVVNKHGSMLFVLNC